MNGNTRLPRRRLELREVHAEIERLIGVAIRAAHPGQAGWYERQAGRWAANRPEAPAPRHIENKRLTGTLKTQDLAGPSGSRKPAGSLMAPRESQR